VISAISFAERRATVLADRHFGGIAVNRRRREKGDLLDAAADSACDQGTRVHVESGATIDAAKWMMADISRHQARQESIIARPPMTSSRAFGPFPRQSARPSSTTMFSPISATAWAAADLPGAGGNQKGHEPWRCPGRRLSMWIGLDNPQTVENVDVFAF
jgi:hypothetical protein